MHACGGLWEGAPSNTFRRDTSLQLLGPPSKSFPAWTHVLHSPGHTMRGPPADLGQRWRGDVQALGGEERRCWCPGPSSGHRTTRPDLCGHQETSALSPAQGQGTHRGRSSTLSWHGTSSVWMREQSPAQMGGQGGCYRYINSSIIFSNMLFSLPKT